MLRDLSRQGLSAQAIADHLPDRTRNAVLGKCHRMGLELHYNGARAWVEGRARPKINNIRTWDDRLTETWEARKARRAKEKARG